MSNPYAPPTEGASRPDLRPDASRVPRAHPGPGAPQGEHPPGPHGPVPPGQRPPRRPTPPPDPETVRRASRQIMHFGLLMLASLVATTLPLPWKVGALVLVVAALVVGARALLTTWRAKIPGLLLPMLVVGLSFASLILLTLLSVLAFWPLEEARQDCERGALTVAAQEQCTREFREGLTQRGDDLRRSVERQPADG